MKQLITITIYPPIEDAFNMTIHVPDNCDEEEYIDRFLDVMLNDAIKYRCEWKYN